LSTVTTNEQLPQGESAALDDLWAFTADQVSRLTGLSLRQLRDWDKTDFFTPQYADGDHHAPSTRLYSFRDLVGLRTIALLIEKKIPVQDLRKVGAWLKESYTAPWSTLTFYVAGRTVVFDDPRAGGRIAGQPLGQMVIQEYPLEKIAAETRREAERLRGRSPEDIGHVVQKRAVVHSQPALAGTRIPTRAIWQFHQEGYDTEGIIRQYPLLTPEDVRAAIAFEEHNQPKKKAG